MSKLAPWEPTRPHEHFTAAYWRAALPELVAGLTDPRRDPSPV